MEEQACVTGGRTTGRAQVRSGSAVLRTEIGKGGRGHINGSELHPKGLEDVLIDGF